MRVSDYAASVWLAKFGVVVPPTWLPALNHSFTTCCNSVVQQSSASTGFFATNIDHLFVFTAQKFFATFSLAFVFWMEANCIFGINNFLYLKSCEFICCQAHHGTSYARTKCQRTCRPWFKSHSSGDNFCHELGPCKLNLLSWISQNGLIGVLCDPV